MPVALPPPFNFWPNPTTWQSPYPPLALRPHNLGLEDREAGLVLKPQATLKASM